MEIKVSRKSNRRTFEDLFLKNLFLLENKETLINLINYLSFKCSPQFWDQISKCITNLYNEFNPFAIINILSIVSYWDSFEVQHWEKLIFQMEEDYEKFDLLLKVISEKNWR